MKKWIRRFVMTILGLVLGTGMYMICAERVLKDPFPMPFGIGFANVVSGSMEPVLKKGTLLLVRKKADAEIGDIVVYQSGESIIVHRIISAEGDQVITKGDANETEDIPIKRSQIKGVVMFKIPEIGKPFQRARCCCYRHRQTRSGSDSPCSRRDLSRSRRGQKTRY